MQHEDLNQRLSGISTLWSVVCRAHQGSAEAANSARKQLFERYGGAIYRYLREILRNADAVDEVFQEFALQLVQGRLRGADPQRGRFRNFVKGTLFHLIADYRQQQRKWAQLLPDQGATLAAPSEEVLSERQFVESWRDELLAHTWAELAKFEARSGRLYYAVLRFRADHLDLPSSQLAEQLTRQLGQPFTAVGVRQTLHRAREKFADLLLDEVVHALEDPTAEQLEQELADLGLLEYCRPALERQGPRAFGEQM
jgi:RNA polymerase sigma-70 factor (ECF subfamily)